MSILQGKKDRRNKDLKINGDGKDMAESEKEKAKGKVKEFLGLYQDHLKKGKFEDQKESNTEKYMEDLFERLGWSRYDLERQKTIEEGRVDYSVNLDEKPYFFVEIKKHRIKDLDPHKRQAINYGWMASTKWVILTNLREIRVYNSQYKGYPESVMRLFPPIKIDKLMDRFDDLWLLSKEGAKKNLLEKRAIETSKIKIKEPISILAGELLRWRSMLTREMRSHPKINEISGREKEAADAWIDEAVQMLLNRFIFLRSIEDLGHWTFSLRSVLYKWKEKKKGSLMEQISIFFKEANDKYDAGLFAPHPCENLILADSVLETIIEEMYTNKKNDVEWDFKALLSDQDILGLAYEQYLGATLTEKMAKIKKSKEKRKKMGIYYTPKHIVEYIAKSTLKDELKKCKNIEDILRIKVLDPACGSGSFLKEAYRMFKTEIKKRGWSKQIYFDKEKSEEMSIYDAILKNCIYGVDLDKKACEMAKLNLLIMAAENETHRLPNLSRTIKQGNSLIDDPSIIGIRLAFSWKEKFPEVFERKNPGFDVVIGNPPYGAELNKNEREYIGKNYKTAKTNKNTAIAFMELGLNITRSFGRFSFIVPKSLAFSQLWKPTRIFIEPHLISLVDASKAFEDVLLEQIVFVTKKDSRENYYNLVPSSAA